ncbi:MAG TPA: ATP-binding cassette domain-containing protein [Streptosporangiaceae bacterium]|jgi:ABC-type lipoprotein export system ATPase subunit
MSLPVSPPVVVPGLSPLTLCRGAYLAIIERPDSGERTMARISGARYDRPDPAAVTACVHREPMLVPTMSALANVELPLAHAARGAAERRQRALAALDLIGMVPWAGRASEELSGAEAKMAAIARALVVAPELIVLDEPAAGLGVKETGRVLAALDRLHAVGVTLLVLTGDPRVAARARARAVDVATLAGHDDPADS